MKKLFFVPVAMIMFCTILFSEKTNAQTCDPIKSFRLKEILTQLGYTVKDLNTTAGKEKYECIIVKDGFDVPVAYEISGSTNYIWLTTFLGNAKTDNGTLSTDLLKQNTKIQPCQFYITDSGKLMLGLAVDNRGVTNALMKRYTEFITGRVTETKSFWNQ